MQDKKQNISPIKQRILYFTDNLGISKREFYKTIDVSRGTLESKTGIIEDIVAKFIAKYPDVNPTWLLTGEGEMLLDFTKGITGGENPDTDREFNEISSGLSVLNSFLQANRKAKDVSDRFDRIKGRLSVIDGYVSEYDLLYKMMPILACYAQKQVKMSDVKDELKANIEVLSEMLSVLGHDKRFIRKAFRVRQPA